MRLHVRDLDTRGNGRLPQQSDLLADPVGEEVSGDVHRTAAEPLPVEVGDLRADDDTSGRGTLADRAHHLRLYRQHPGCGIRGVAGMEAARDVRAGHDLEQAGVVGHTFAQIGVQVDPAARPGHLLGRSVHGPSLPVP